MALLMLCQDKLTEDLRKDGYEDQQIGYEKTLDRTEHLIHINLQTPISGLSAIEVKDEKNE